MRRAASWALAALAALALVAGVVLAYAQHTVFSAAGFADRAAATLDRSPVRAAVARQVSDAAVQAQPDLVAVRPLIETAANGILRTEAFRALLRAAALDLQRSAFDRDARTVTLSVADAGILLSDALRRLQRPGSPAGFPTASRRGSSRRRAGATRPRCGSRSARTTCAARCRSPSGPRSCSRAARWR
jgi:uncharacterized protein with GYD domain